MPRILKLQDTDSQFRKLVESVRQRKEECVVQDEQDRPVAVVLPIERYENYQAYLRQREEDFAVFEEVAEDLKGYDPDFLEAQIEKAVAEMKVEAKAKREDA